MTDTNDGFVISEKDLELRGSGEFFGTRQHGLPEFKIANLFEDMPILKQVQALAVKITEEDRKLYRNKWTCWTFEKKDKGGKTMRKIKEKRMQSYVLRARKMVQQTNDLNRLCKEYREKLTEAMNDNTRLINNNKELEKRLAVLGHEVSQLKEKLESVEKGKEKAEEFINNRRKNQWKN